jgi:hypothetical protein
MIEVHYGVVQLDGQWTVISEGLRLGGYKSQDEAEAVARRMADQAVALPVQIHLQEKGGEFHKA